MNTKASRIARGQLLIQEVACGAIYPRSLTEVIHLVIYDDITWEELRTNPYQLLVLFETAWMKYTGYQTRDEFALYDEFVFQDFESQLARSDESESRAGVDAQIYHFPTHKAA